MDRRKPDPHQTFSSLRELEQYRRDLEHETLAWRSQAQAWLAEQGVKIADPTPEQFFAAMKQLQRDEFFERFEQSCRD